MVDLEKLVVGTAVALIALTIGILVYERGEEVGLKKCPEPAEVVCIIKAIHPATDGGKMLTVHCPVIHDFGTPNEVG